MQTFPVYKLLRAYVQQPPPPPPPPRGAPWLNPAEDGEGVISGALELRADCLECGWFTTAAAGTGWERLISSSSVVARVTVTTTTDSRFSRLQKMAVAAAIFVTHVLYWGFAPLGLSFSL